MRSDGFNNKKQGMTVTSGLGNLVAIERAGIETKEFGIYLLGDIDVPAPDSFSAAKFSSSISP